MFNAKNLTIGQKKALFESLRYQKSPMTPQEKATLEELRPTVKVKNVKREREVNNLCSWETIIKTYKSCTLEFNEFGVIRMHKLGKRRTYKTNSLIKELTHGYKLIK